MKTLAKAIFLTSALAMLVGVGSASAAPAGPRLSLSAETFPTVISRTGAVGEIQHLAPNAGGALELLVTDVGGAPTSAPLSITDRLPSGLRAIAVSGGPSPNNGNATEGTACTFTSSTVTCSYTGALGALSTVGLNIEIEVEAEPGAAGMLAAPNVANVSGGGVATVSASNVVSVGSQEPPFALDGPLEASLRDAGGAVDTQAGDHPAGDTTGFALNTTVRPFLRPAGEPPEFVFPVQEAKDVAVVLPPGLVGNPQAAATCPQYLVAPPHNGVQCPRSSIVGSLAIRQEGEPSWILSKFTGNVNDAVAPIYNVPPEQGHPAQFAFVFSNQEATLYANLVHTGGGYAIEVKSDAILRKLKLTGAKVTFFGDPTVADETGGTPTAFFTNPSDCAGGPSTTRMYMDSWENPGQQLPDGTPNLSDSAWVGSETSAPAPTGCNKLQFKPEFKALPTTTHSDAPSGLNVDLKIPQNEEPEGLATPPLKDVTVELPRGLSISPSSANGLQACSDAQFNAESTEPSTCPEASIVGSVKVHTPLLKEELEGHVFVGTPQCSPCSNSDAQSGRLVRLFIEITNAERGIDVKLPGTVSIDPSTGQLTATFKESPQQPFDNLEFKFKSGERAPLSTSPACGSYTTDVDLAPWSTPYTPDANLTPGFAINEGCGPQGFAPAFSSGPQSSQAGAYSPLTLSFSRNDGEQDFNSLEATLPPGQLAKLAGVPRCGEAEANAGTCPESTKIGTVTVGAGPGADPYYVTGQIYLTGPYNGGPFGEVVEVPAVAGPFNLGTVAVRGSIRVNPSTIQATVVSNPFPSILDGIPLQVRTVNVTLNREDFTVNPTSCAPQAVTGKLVSTQNASAALSSPVQAVNCANLAFKPDLTASVSGRASKAGGAGFDVKVTYPSGPAGTYANTKSVKVDLPKQLPSRLTTLQKACIAATFEANPASCPAASDVGTATAVTPLLGVPVNGPAYLVSHGGEAFPDLEVVLQGEGVTAIVVFNTSIKKGITSSTLKAAPDVPLSSFELKLPTGKFSILGANLPASAHYSLCGQKLSMPTSLTGQNGTPIKQNTKIGVTGCPKVKKAKKVKASKARKAGNNGRAKK